VNDLFPEPFVAVNAELVTDVPWVVITSTKFAALAPGFITEPIELK
jgi:hypothetical protein